MSNSIAQIYNNKLSQYVNQVALIGFTLGIPDSIMGITFLAAGTSVPDAYASIHVAKQVIDTLTSNPNKLCEINV